MCLYIYIYICVYIYIYMYIYVGVEDVSMITGEEVNAYDAYLVFFYACL
jgi:hypothetical protein